MKTDNKQLQKVATIPANWQGSDGADQASPNEVAAEIDGAYAEYLDSLPKRTAIIRNGQKEWGRKVA